MQNIENTIKELKLTKDEYQNILKILGRKPNMLELQIFSSMWSEHSAPWVIQGPGENAGVIDIGGGMAAIFFIEPYQGAATGVGGILRDVFTMGARPVANLNSLRFGNISKNDKNGKYQRYLVRGVVSGIGDYGNCMGVPTIGGETFFDDCYNGNILVNAFTLGVCKSNEIFYGKAEGAGNLVIYVGSKTGRDGLGGAVMASDSFTEENKSLRPTVQVGDPFTEKLLLEACLELFKKDYIIGIQDMGAAGLTSSSFEMAGRSGSGMKMYLDKVPAREEGMEPFEFMLSESQERMLICAKKGFEEKVLKIFKDWDLDAEVIGEVTDSGNMELYWHNEKVADIPIGPIAQEAPVLDRPIRKPEYLQNIKNISVNLKDLNIDKVFDKLISSNEVVDKSWIYKQYDSMVQTNTIKGPGKLDSSVIRVKEKAAVMESGRNVAMSGATPKAITDCLNYGNPENPEIMWQFAKGCEGIKEACKALNTPVVSGNVSLYNETNGVGIFPTPAIVMVGVNNEATKTLPNCFQENGNSIYLVGDTKSDFGGSLLLKEIFNKVEGVLPVIDYQKELALWNLTIEANNNNLIKSAKDVNVGGIAIDLYKMAVVGSKGIKVKSSFDEKIDIFSESFSRALFEVCDDNKFEKLANKFGIKYEKIGIIEGDKFILDDIERDLSKLQDIYFNSFNDLIEKDI